jgi:hypothetical protein
MQFDAKETPQNTRKRPRQTHTPAKLAAAAAAAAHRRLLRDTRAERHTCSGRRPHPPATARDMHASHASNCWQEVLQ